MQQLSPRKYIETKVRTLPIYKCLVNKDWEETKMAEVLVMRKHNNGHITAGVYLVDLLCLGIRDTFYFFNEPEEEIEGRIGPEFKDIFIEIEYNLAHNIVYAGMDFAMEFEITPHKDFALTCYILEDDTDDIPLIEIAVGSEDGKPHLIVSHSNQCPEALSKLKRIAGEDNYYYTVEDEEDVNKDDQEEDDEHLLELDDIPLGGLNMINVQDVSLDDLMDVEKVKQRKISEQIIINAESVTRLLPDEIQELAPEEEDRWDKIWDDILDQAEFPNGMDQKIMDEYYEAMDELIRGEQELQDGALGDDAMTNNLVKVLDAHASNPMVLVNIFETGTVMSLEEVAEKAKGYLNQYQQQYPYLQISLALGALLNDTRDIRFNNIYNAKRIHEAFPQVKQFYPSETIKFWMCKMCLSLEEENLKDAVQYYYVIRETQLNDWLFEPILIKYTNFLMNYLRTTQMGS